MRSHCSVCLCVCVCVCVSGSELLYDWRFTAKQLVLATSPLRLTTNTFIFQLNTWGYSPYVTSFLTRGWVCRLQLLMGLASAVSLKSESRETRDHILLSQIRDSPKLDGQVPIFIYIPQEQSGPVIPSDTGFPLRRLLRVAGQRWRYVWVCVCVSFSVYITGWTAEITPPPTAGHVVFYAVRVVSKNSTWLILPRGARQNMVKSHACLESENDCAGEGQQQFARLDRPRTITLVSYMVHSSTLNMEETCSSETSFVFQRSTWRYIPEDRILHQRLCENLRSYMFLTIFESLHFLPVLCYYQILYFMK
jgi:hypothetical protein